MKKLFLSNKLFILFFILFLCQSFRIISQNTTSLKLLNTYGGSGIDFLSVIVETSDGYLLGGSSFSGPSGTKTAPSYGENDYWIIKTDKAFNPLWDKSYGGSGFDILSKVLKTSDGGYLLFGTSRSVPSGNKTAPFKSDNVSYGDIWLIKISSNGTILWDKSYGGNFYDQFSDAIETPDGGFIIVGISNSEKNSDKSQNPYGYLGKDGFFDVWLIKIDPYGIILWDKIYGGTDDIFHGGDYGHSIIKGNDGNYIISASSNARIGNDKSADNYCEHCEEYNDGSDYWIIKIKPDGTKVWDKVFGGTGEDANTLVQIHPNGGYLVGGYSTSSISGNKTIEAPTGFSHMYWIHITEDGEKIKENLYDEPQFSFVLMEGMQTDTNGYYLSYYSNDSEGIYVIKVIHYDWSDNIIWEWSESSTELRINGGLKVTTDGQVLMAFNKFIDNNGDIWLYKYNGPAQSPTNINLKVKQVGKDVVINASTIPDYQFKKIEFFADNLKIGEDVSAPYTATWNNAPVKTSYLRVTGTNLDNSQLLSPTIPFTVKRAATSLYRAINFNGPTLTIDSITFESSASAVDFMYQARRFENQSVSLIAPPDPPRDHLIRSSLFSTRTTPAFFTFSNVPTRAYELYFYVWEDNYAQTFSIWINGSLALEKYNSGTAGHWEKIGPLKTTVNTGKIEIRVEGGDANMSAVEIHKFAEYDEFYRAINLNGPTMKVDNLTFEGSLAASNFSYQAKAFANQSVPLRFPPDAKKSNMIRSSLYSTVFTPAFFTFKNVPAGEYDAYIYVWEDNYFQYYSLWINDSIAIKDHFSGNLGDWDILGPFKTQSRNGIIQIKAAGGDANISAIELWKKKTTVSAYPNSESTLQSFNRVYPNPIGESLKIDLPDFNEGKTTVTISDIFGRVYLKKELTLNLDKKLDLKLPLSEMKKGHYILKIQTNTESQIFKLYNE